MTEQNNKSPHILNTSATLMGLCFVVLTSFSINKMAEKSMIDELTAMAIFMFMISCVLSFLSMRSIKKSGIRYEKIADFVFLAGLIFLFITTGLIVFNIIWAFALIHLCFALLVIPLLSSLHPGYSSLNAIKLTLMLTYVKFHITKYQI